MNQTPFERFDYLIGKNYQAAAFTEKQLREFWEKAVRLPDGRLGKVTSYNIESGILIVFGQGQDWTQIEWDRVQIVPQMLPIVIEANGQRFPLIPVENFATESQQHPANVAARIDECSHAYVALDGSMPLAHVTELERAGWHVRFYGHDSNGWGFFMAKPNNNEIK